MIVLAGESGLRADEICHLDALGEHRDLFYERNLIQTRHGKAVNGSGKRVRKTIFTKRAQEVMHIYEDQVRPYFREAKTNVALFLSERGDRIEYSSMWEFLDEIVEKARKEGAVICQSSGISRSGSWLNATSIDPLSYRL
jgi:site-specific recombinase XerD